MLQTFVFERKVRFSQRIRAIKVGGQEYFPSANIQSIKAMASRIGNTSKPKRIYHTQKEDGGIVVFRDK